MKYSIWYSRTIYSLKNDLILSNTSSLAKDLLGERLNTSRRQQLWSRLTGLTASYTTRLVRLHRVDKLIISKYRALFAWLRILLGKVLKAIVDIDQAGASSAKKLIPREESSGVLS